MNRIFALCISDFPIHSLESLMECVSNKKRLIKLYRVKDRIRSLAGELLIRKLISEIYDIPCNTIEFAANSYGKPFLLKPRLDLEFNISHAGEWVVCVIGSDTAGIDIERK